MKITLKLFATLTDYLPEHARRSNVLELDVTDGTTVQQVIDPVGMPARLVHLVLVNGRFIEPDKRAGHVLVPDDVLAIWPPIAGG